MGLTPLAIRINPQTTVFVDPVAVTEFYQRASSAQRWAFQAQVAQLTSRREAFDPGERRISTMQQVNSFVLDALHNPRVQGSLQVLGGAAEVSAGVGITFGTGFIAAPIGHFIIVHGLDHVTTGFYSVVTGKQKNTATQLALETAGLSSEIAVIGDAALSITGMGMGAKAIAQLATYSQFKLPPPYISEAYLAAKSGGKHAPIIDLYGGKTPKEILKGINSYEKQIALHQDKIMNPSKYYPDWNKLDPRRRQALIDKIWPAEIQCSAEQMNILQTILEQKR
jgi:hypothetical protein